MMNRLGQWYAKLFLLSLLGLFFFLGLKQPTLAEGYDTTILAIDVTGNEQVPIETILKAVTHVRLGEPWNAEQIQLDLRAIQELGYFSIVEAKDKPFLGGLKLVFKVKENPKFTGFKFEGLTKVKPEYLEKLFTQEKGKVINISKLMMDFAEARHRTQEETGYILAYRDHEIGVDGTITMNLTEVKLRKILVTGLTRTKEIVVRREITLKEGEVFNLLELRENFQQLARRQIFSGINPVIKSTDSSEWVDLVFEITESEQFGTLNFGLGYSPDEGKLLGNAQIGYNNLGGMARTGNFTLQMGEEITKIHLEYADPWFLPNRTSLRTRLFYNDEKNIEYEPESDKEGLIGQDDFTDLYDERRYGFELTMGRPVGRNSMLNASLSIQRVDIENWIDGQDLSGTGDVDYWNNSIGLSFVNDNRQFASGGTTVIGGSKNTVSSTFYGLLGGGFNYQTFTVETAQYYTPWQSGPTFALRLKGGYMTGDENDRPPMEGFRLGGVTTIRGYDDTIVRNDKLFLANLESRYYFKSVKGLAAVVFYDYGSVDFDDFYSSYGIGLRYTIPMLGNIRLDYAWNGEGDSPELHFFVGEMF
jgi:outer membrane protein insertion porin family